MKKILLSKKTGFDIINPFRPVVIRDSKGREFFSTESQVPNITEFNLPAKIPLYIETGHFRDKKHPVNYKLVKLPRKERFGKSDPKRFKVLYRNNPNTCSIDWKNKRIIFDHQIKELPIPYQSFILYHEFGHQHYTTEENADLFARNAMFKRGYNPIQVLLAPHYTLNDKNNYRKEIIANSILSA